MLFSSRCGDLTAIEVRVAALGFLDSLRLCLDDEEIEKDTNGGKTCTSTLVCGLINCIAIKSALIVQ